MLYTYCVEMWVTGILTAPSQTPTKNNQPDLLWHGPNTSPPHAISPNVQKQSSGRTPPSITRLDDFVICAFSFLPLFSSIFLSLKNFNANPRRHVPSSLCTSKLFSKKRDISLHNHSIPLVLTTMSYDHQILTRIFKCFQSNSTLLCIYLFLH